MGYLPVFAAALHVGVRGARVASVHEIRIALRGEGGVTGTRQAVRRVARSRANMGREPSKGTTRDTDGVAVDGPGQVAEVVGAGEHVGRGEVSSVQCLIPPREGAVETTLVPQDLLEGPEVVAVPDEELGVAVDVRHVHLVQAGEILIAVRRGRKVTRRRLAHQALDGGDEGQPVGGRELSPFKADVGVGRARRRRRGHDGGHGSLGGLSMRRVELRRAIHEIRPGYRILQREGVELGEGVRGKVDGAHDGRRHRRRGEQKNGRPHDGLKLVWDERVYLQT